MGHPPVKLANTNDSHYIHRMTVRICHLVSDSASAGAACKGCASFDHLQLELSVATADATCRDCLTQTFEAHSAMMRRPLVPDHPHSMPPTLRHEAGAARIGA